VAKLNLNKNSPTNMLHMHPHVELPDGNYTLMTEGGDEGANGEVHYVVVDQDLDLDQSPTLPSKASPR
jgi:hypothetical protein